jgi:hypothetical protein
MREETHRDKAHRLDTSLSTAATALASISPCPFAPGRPLSGNGHYDNLSPQCRARGLRRRRARPFIVKMMEFVESRRDVDTSISWETLMSEWNSGHELHRYSSHESMREAYSNAVRRHRGGNPAPEVCRVCVLEDLRRRAGSRTVRPGR